MAARRKKPAKQGASKSKAVARRGSSAIAKFDPSSAAHDLGGEVDRATTVIGADGNFISTKGAKFKIPGDDEQYTEIEGFIIDDVYVNMYYEGDYDPNEMRGAACYAIGRDPDALAPGDDVLSPVAEACRVCPNDVFGSAAKGNSKACKNTFRLLFVPAKGADNAFQGTEVFKLSVPAASMKAYRKYKRDLEMDGITKTWGVACEVSVHPSPNGGHELAFEPVGAVSGELANVLDEIAKKSAADLFAAPTLDRDEDKAKKKPAKRSARRRRT